MQTDTEGTTAVRRTMAASSVADVDELADGQKVLLWVTVIKDDHTPPGMVLVRAQGRPMERATPDQIMVPDTVEVM